MEEKQKKPVWKIIIDVLLWIVLIFFVFVAIIGIIFRINNQNSEAITIGNHQYYIVETESMSKNNSIPEEEYQSYEIHDIQVEAIIGVEVKTDDNRTEFYNNLKVGDVLNFYYHFTKGAYRGKYLNITHRLIEKVTDPEHSGEFILTMRGDVETATSDDTQVITTYNDNVNVNKIMGKVVSVNLGLGKTIHFLSSPAGLIIFIIAPSLGLFIYEIIRIVMIVKKEKAEAGGKKPYSEDAQKEIDELKKELEALKAKTKAEDDNDSRD